MYIFGGVLSKSQKKLLCGKKMVGKLKIEIMVVGKGKGRQKGGKRGRVVSATHLPPPDPAAATRC